MSAEYSEELFALALPEKNPIVEASDIFYATEESYFKASKHYVDNPSPLTQETLINMAEGYANSIEIILRAMERDEDSTLLSFTQECFTILSVIDDKRADRLNTLLKNDMIKPTTYEPLVADLQELNPRNGPEYICRAKTRAQLSEVAKELVAMDTYDFIKYVA